MSKYLPAEQYESAFKPRALRNWEVPRYHSKTLRTRNGDLSHIGNSRGHLLPGALRSTYDPWSHFVGTWRMPQRITREIACQLSGRRRDNPFVVKRKARANKESVEPVEYEQQEQVQEELIRHEEEMKSSSSKVMCPIHDLMV